MKKLLVILLFITATSMSAGYSDALKLFEAKKYKEALAKVAEVLETKNDMEANSPNYKLRYLAAHCHWKLGNYKSVVAHFSRCMIIKKTTVDPYIDLALSQIDNKLYGEAVASANRGLKIKEDAMLYYILGKVSMLWGKNWRAKTLFEKANSINSELFIVYHDLGIVLLKMKKYSEANTAFSVAVALDSKSGEAKNNLALTYELLNQKKKAKQYYREASTILNENVVVKKNLTRIKSAK